MLNFEEGPSLEDSLLLDRHRTIESSELDALCRQMFSLIRSDQPNMRYVEDHQAILQLVLVNLFRADLLEETPYIAYQRDNNAFGPGTRYYELGIKRAPLKRVTDWLAAHDYTAGRKGIQYPDGGFGRITRMRATPKLRKLFEKYSWQSTMLKSKLRAEVIVLKDSDKVEIAYADTPETKKMRRAVETVNEFLSTVRIHIRGRLRPVGYYHRVFNQSSFAFGGRWYGHWILNLKNDPEKAGRFHTREQLVKRGLLTLNGETTVELDYHALHLIMLYHKMGLQAAYDDSYDLSQYGYGREYRSFIKKSAMCLINNDSEESARKAINSMTYSKEFRGLPAVDPVHLMRVLKEHYQHISHLLFKNAGASLQREDSEITETIMLHFVELGIPCLCLHDSYIVPRSSKNELIDTMVAAYQRKFPGCGPMIHD